MSSLGQQHVQRTRLSTRGTSAHTVGRERGNCLFWRDIDRQAWAAIHDLGLYHGREMFSRLVPSLNIRCIQTETTDTTLTGSLRRSTLSSLLVKVQSIGTWRRTKSFCIPSHVLEAGEGQTASQRPTAVAYMGCQACSRQPYTRRGLSILTVHLLDSPPMHVRSLRTLPTTQGTTTRGTGRLRCGR